jgi:hypothetical protein
MHSLDSYATSFGRSKGWTYLLRLSPLEDRRALLDDGADAFAAILGRHEIVKARELDPRTPGQIALRATVDRVRSLPPVAGTRYLSSWIMPILGINPVVWEI